MGNKSGNRATKNAIATFTSSITNVAKPQMVNFRSCLLAFHSWLVSLWAVLGAWPDVLSSMLLVLCWGSAGPRTSSSPPSFVSSPFCGLPGPSAIQMFQSSNVGKLLRHPIKFGDGSSFVCEFYYEPLRSICVKQIC